MANQKISALTSNPGIDGTEEMPTAKSGSNFKNTLSALKTWLQGVLGFSNLSDTYDLSTASVGSVPMKTTSSAALAPILLFDQDPIIVDAATTAALSGSYNYSNGTLGVGATLTKTTNGAFQSVDGVASGLNKTYLIKNFTGANRKYNGVYQLTQVGSAGTPSILTRLTSGDESSELNGQVVIPSGGNTLARRVFSQVTINPTVGTSNIVYSVATNAAAADLQQVTDRGNTTDNAIICDDGAGTTTQISSSSGLAQTLTTGETATFNTSGFNIADLIGNSSSGSPQYIGVGNFGTGTGVNMFATGEVSANALQLQDLFGSVVQLRFVKKQLNPAEVKNSFSSPVELIGAPGAGTAIRVLDVTVNNTFSTTAFDNQKGFIYSAGVSDRTTMYQRTISSALIKATSSRILPAYEDFTTIDNSESRIIDDAPVRFSLGADSVNGDGTLTFYIWYLIMTL